MHNSVNTVRGEVSITLNGKIFAMRPTFEALSHIEHETGCGIIALARQLHEGALSLQHIVTIVVHAVNAAKQERVKREEVGEWVLAQGVATVIKPVSELLAGVLGGYDNA